MIDQDVNLKLVGYVTLTSHSYALPLFGQWEGANTLYVAKCTVPGDHMGQILEFEPVDTENVIWLQSDSPPTAKPGTPWQDVFLWEGQPYVGPPSSLWSQLAPYRPALQSRAPLSLLDLALNAEAPDALDIAPIAFCYTQTRFGNMRAQAWRRNLLKARIEISVRRKSLGQTRAGEFSPGQFEVVETTPNELSILPPPDMPKDANHLKALDEALDDLDSLATALGITLLKSVDIQPVSPPILPVHQTGMDEQFASRVAVFSVSRRAQDLVRHVENAAPHMFGVGVEISIFDNLYMLDLTSIRPADLLLLVMDDDDGVSAPGNDLLNRAIELATTSETIVLLVPALPSAHPSRFLTGDGTFPDVLRDVHAVLDTSIARSPFWWGNPKRSLERRIGDIISTGIRACLASDVREALRKNRRLMPLLCVAQYDEHIKGASYPLSSEATWRSDRSGEHADTYFSYLLPERDIGPTPKSVYVEGRRNVPDFARFAMAAVSEMFHDRRGRLRTVRRADNDPRLTYMAEQLKFPEQLCMLTLDGQGDDPVSLVVTAETPGLAAVHAADQAGWSVARYTDEATILRLAGPVVKAAGSLPDEVDIGNIRSAAPNRQIAARGVDQRDIVRASYDECQEWLDQLSFDDRKIAQDCARPVRTAKSPYGNTSDEHVIRRDFLLSHSLAADRLFDIISRRGAGRDLRPIKRGGDLQRCWTPPRQDFRRFAIVDGVLPVAVVELQPGEVPMQDMFIVDGDYSVPVLFQSRPFTLWAQATLPTASSWMARFSIRSTFGGFPIPKPFEIIHQTDGVSALIASFESPEMERLSSEIAQQILRSLASGKGDNWKTAHRLATDLPAAEELNDRVLEYYGLSPRATDIEIMLRLKDMNDRLDEESLFAH